MLSGCESKARTNTYKLCASYAIRASVGIVGFASSVGWNCRKSRITDARCHTSSLSLPSMTGAEVARCATAVVALGALGGGGETVAVCSARMRAAAGMGGI